MRLGRLIAVGAVVIASAACGGSDESGADSDEANVANTEESESSDEGAFCDQVRELDESGDTDEDIAAAAEDFAALVDRAPEELRDDLQVVSDAFSEVSDLDEDDPESFAMIFEVFGRADVIEATENLERFGVEECGLEPTAESGGADGLDDAVSDDAVSDDVEAENVADADADADADSDADADADRYDEEFWGPIVATELSIPGIKQHLDLNYPDTGWFDTLNGYGITSDTDVGVDGPIDDADGVALCDAILEYAAPIEADVTISVDGVDGEELATGNVEDGCSAAA